MGTRFPKIAAFPLWRRMPSLPQRWEMASPSDCPVCLARQLPSFLTCLSAVVCHPPIDSTTKGRKENPLALAVLCCTSHLPIMGKLKGMSRFQSCLSHCCCLEGVDDCDIQSSIAASIPVWEEDVCRPAIIPW